MHYHDIDRNRGYQRFFGIEDFKLQEGSTIERTNVLRISLPEGIEMDVSKLNY
jgi:hypothetical protein